MHTHVHTHSWTHKFMCTHIHTHTHIHACTHTFMLTHIYAHTYSCTHTFMNTHIHEHTYIHTQTHRHTHTMTLCQVEVGYWEAEFQPLSEGWGFWKVFEGSSYSDLRLVSLKKDRMANWSATAMNTCPDLALDLLSQFISNSKGLLAGEAAHKAFAWAAMLLSQIRSMRKTPTILEARHLCSLVMASLPSRASV